MRAAPSGVVQSDGTLKIAIKLPRPLFNYVVNEAERRHSTFSDALVFILKTGQTCLTESDALEPR